MPAYRFEAATVAGRIEKGTVDADSPKQARGLLRERGLTPIAVNPIEDGSRAGGSMTIGGRAESRSTSVTDRRGAIPSTA